MVLPDAGSRRASHARGIPRGRGDHRTEPVELGDTCGHPGGRSAPGVAGRAAHGGGDRRSCQPDSAGAAGVLPVHPDDRAGLHVVGGGSQHAATAVRDGGGGGRRGAALSRAGCRSPPGHHPIAGGVHGGAGVLREIAADPAGCRGRRGAVGSRQFVGRGARTHAPHPYGMVCGSRIVDRDGSSRRRMDGPLPRLHVHRRRAFDRPGDVAHVAVDQPWTGARRRGRAVVLDPLVAEPADGPTSRLDDRGRLGGPDRGGRLCPLDQARRGPGPRCGVRLRRRVADPAVLEPDKRVHLPRVGADTAVSAGHRLGDHGRDGAAGVGASTPTLLGRCSWSLAAQLCPFGSVSDNCRRRGRCRLHR